ncbi:TPA: hypothetical protein ACUA5O_004511, partial [Escherichia coli]
SGEKRVFLVILFTSFSGSLVSRIPGAVHFDVEAYIADDKNLLRKEDIQITLEEFFKTFKRFSIKISRKGEFDDQEIEFKE